MLADVLVDALNWLQARAPTTTTTVSPSVLALSGIVVALILRRLSITISEARLASKLGCAAPGQLGRLRNIKQQIAADQSHTWLEMWCKRYAECGLTFSSASVSFEQILFTIDPENVKSVLATDFKHWDMGERKRNVLSPLVGFGIFTNDGKAWEHSRALLRPTFNKMRVSDLDFFEHHFQSLLAALPPVNPHSGMVEVDLGPFFFRYTLDSSSEVILGKSVKSLETEAGSPSHNFMDAFDYAQLKVHTRDLLHRGYMKPLGMIINLMKGKGPDRFERSCATVKEFIDSVIQDWMKDKEVREQTEKSGETDDQRYTFLDEMAKDTNDPRELRDEILNVMIAGRDTTASLLTNAFFFMSRHPDVWESVRQEVIEAFGDRLPDYETLRNLKQLKNVLSECLRLTPPVPFNTRTATANTTLPRGGGPDGKSPVFVKAGQQLNYHVFAMHRLPEIWGEDASEFRPSRWEDSKLRPGWGYIPFNGGPRICLGQQFALTEATYAISRLMQHFSACERRDPTVPWVEHLSLVSKSRKGAKVALMKA